MTPRPKGWLVVVLLVCFTAIAQGQSGTVLGTVRAGDQPLPRAVVEARSGDTVRARARADETGGYRLSVSPGVYTLGFRMLGYAERRIEGIRVDSGQTVTVDALLTAVVLTLDHIAVTALRRTEKALDAPVSIAVIDEQVVRERTVVTPVEYVIGIAGVDVVQQGVQGRQVVARGFSQTFGTSLLMMTDYRTASVPSLRANLVQFVTPTADDLDRIEVLRGPASALYGPNAADGVVHFLTKSPFDSPGTTMTLVGGGRDLFEGAARHASTAGDRLAFKISGDYLHAREWRAPADATERAGRDPTVERLNGELRLDYQATPTGIAVLTLGSTLDKRHVEYLSIGTSQIKNWRYDFAQLRFADRRFFAQTYININDAGRTFSLNTLNRVFDRSTLLVGQLQHGFDIGRRNTITYGADVQRTDPKTNGTINGRNEAEDVALEAGAYAQVEARPTATLQLLAAARVDRHDRVKGAVLSPRLALQYAPSNGQRLRVAYNRAFSTPTQTDLFVDIEAARLSPLPFSLRAVGVPKDGFHFGRDCNGGLCMFSPFAPGQRLPLDATALWPAVVQIMKANAVDLSALPAPTARDVRTVLRLLDTKAGTFRQQSGELRDIEPLVPTITNSVEAGYKGLVGGVLAFDGTVYATRRENFRGPLAVETPNAFLSAPDLAAYLARFMPPAQASQLAAAIGGLDGSAAAPGIPLATIGPDGRLGGPDIILTYRNFGRVELWGADLSAEVLATRRVTFLGSYSYVSDNFFPASKTGLSDLSMNAPRHKATLGARFRDAPRELTAELRGRYVGSFRMLDGVWIGEVPSFAVFDAEFGFALPGNSHARLTFTAQNVLDDRHAEFVAAPVLGRLLLTRLQYRF